MLLGVWTTVPSRPLADVFLVVLPFPAFFPSTSLLLRTGTGEALVASSLSLSESFSSLTSPLSEIGETTGLTAFGLFAGGGSALGLLGALPSASELALLVTLKGGGSALGALTPIRPRGFPIAFLSIFEYFCFLGGGFPLGDFSVDPSFLFSGPISPDLLSPNNRFLLRILSMTIGFGDSAVGEPPGVLIGEISSGLGGMGEPGIANSSSSLAIGWTGIDGA